MHPRRRAAASRRNLRGVVLLQRNARELDQTRNSERTNEIHTGKRSEQTKRAGVNPFRPFIVARCPANPVGPGAAAENSQNMRYSCRSAATKNRRSTCWTNVCRQRVVAKLNASFGREPTPGDKDNASPPERTCEVLSLRPGEIQRPCVFFARGRIRGRVRPAEPILSARQVQSAERENQPVAFDGRVRTTGQRCVVRRAARASGDAIYRPQRDPINMNAAGYPGDAMEMPSEWPSESEASDIDEKRCRPRVCGPANAVVPGRCRWRDCVGT